MLVKDIVELVKISSLNNLAISKNESALIKFIYLGVSELYRRFNLVVKIESIVTNPDLALYELRSKDVGLLLGLYNSKGQELTQTDVLGGEHDYKIMNYRSFLLNKPKNDLIFVLYKATPAKLNSMEDEIDLPDAMIDALLKYVSYLGHSTINKDNVNETMSYFTRFEEACKSLEMQGYRIPLQSESINLKAKGYV